MCGISGQINFSEKKDYIKEMTQELYSRGPDDFGYYFYKEKSFNLSFGHRRLAILDIENGSQPMSWENDRYIIVYNGEIYNWKNLREELTQSGYSFLTKNSDTEVILAGYKRWGTKVSNYLNGMWAFSIFDKKKKYYFFE